MTPACDLVRHEDEQVLAAELASEVARRLREAIATRGRASLVVAGGKTPLPVFRALRQEHLDWASVVVTLTDERWVDPEDAASNEGLVRRELLVDLAAAAHFVPLKNEASTAAEGAERAWLRLLAEVPQPFDVVVLGMGEDAHTASLFPGSAGIGTALDPSAAPACVALRAPVAPTERLSLNLSALVNSRQLIVHFTGDAKWRTWQVAGDLPIGLTLRQAASPPRLYWSP